MSDAVEETRKKHQQINRMARFRRHVETSRIGAIDKSLRKANLSFEPTQAFTKRGRIPTLQLTGPGDTHDSRAGFPITSLRLP